MRRFKKIQMKGTHIFDKKKYKSQNYVLYIFHIIPVYVVFIYIYIYNIFFDRSIIAYLTT